MSEVDAAVQLVKVEIDSMQYVFKVVGTSGLALVKGFVKLIKFLGKVRQTHKIKNLDKLYGEVCLADFKEKYRGDNIEMFELRDYDADAFIDMCKKEGIAVVRLPDLNPNDGMCQFMVAGSTRQLIKFNIEKLSEAHIKNKRNPEYMKGEVPDFAFVEYAEKKGDNDIIPVKVRDEYSSPEFLQACKDNNIPVMRKEGSDKQFFVSKSDFYEEVFQEVCSKYMQVTEDKVLRTKSISELKDAIFDGNHVNTREKNVFAAYVKKLGELGYDDNIVSVRIKEEYKTSAIVEACDVNGIPAFSPEEDGREVFLSKYDFDKPEFQETFSEFIEVPASMIKDMTGEVPDFAFLLYAEKKGDNDIVPVKVADEYNSSGFIEACKEKGIQVMRHEDSDNEFHVTKSDFESTEFQETCRKYIEVKEDKILRTVELSELKSAISEENYVSGKEIDAIDYVMSAPGDTAEQKQANFTKQTEKLIPSDTLASVNFSDKDQVYNLLINASNDERMMLCESNDYESFPVYENMIVGEDDKVLSVALNGTQYDIDKGLVVTKDGYTRAYVPRNSEAAVLGNVTCGGRKIDASTLNKAVKEKRNINVTDAVKDINVLKGRSK